MKTCDIAKVPVINALLEVPPPKRDSEWRQRFFQNVVDASFACGTPQMFIGPDGFPYFALHSPEPHKPFDSFCLRNLVEPCLANGAGAAINPRGERVDWVFSYGDLLSLRMFDVLEVRDAPPRSNLPQRETIVAGETVLVGQPSESYLPSVARASIKAFLERKLGLRNPGVYLMHRPKDNPPQQLVFSVFRNQYRSDDEFRSILQAISWFLPRHYVVVGLQARDKAMSDFVPL